MPIKAKDLAQMLGVSEATISMVINNKNGISKKRRLEILNKIRELNCTYILKNKVAHDKSIGFVVYERHGKITSESPFFSLIIEGISSGLRKNDYNLVFIQFDKNNLEHSINQLLKSNCHGFIVFATEAFEDDLQILKGIGLPFVIVDNNFDTEDIDIICINNQLGIKKSLQYLYDLGHHEIGYIKSKIEINSFIERINTFYKIMKELNLPVDLKHIFELNYSEIDAYNDMKKLLSNTKKPPTALIADNDLLAFAAIHAIQDYGYKVPEDISVIGFDDRPVCLTSKPQITTISVPKDIMGPASVDLLMDKINKDREESIKVTVGVKLIIRESTSKPRDL